MAFKNTKGCGQGHLDNIQTKFSMNLIRILMDLETFVTIAPKTSIHFKKMKTTL